MKRSVYLALTKLIAESGYDGVTFVFVVFGRIRCMCSILTETDPLRKRTLPFNWTQNFMFSSEPESLQEQEMPPKGKRHGRPSQSPPPSASPDGKKAAGRKSIRPVDREPMKAWLRGKLNRQDLPDQLWWKSGEEGRVFCVRWPHAARQGYRPSEDAKLYKAWAIHSGIYYEGDVEDHKKWKSNFRCAIHSLPDVEELTAPGQKKGSGAVRTYKFLERPRDKKKKRRYTKQESTSSSDSCESDLCGSPSPLAANAEPPFVTSMWPEETGSSVLVLQPEESQTQSIVFQSPNIPNFPVLGLSSNIQMVNLASQSGGTMTVVRESAEGESGGSAQGPIISFRIPSCTPISEELLDSIEDVQDVTPDDIKEEVEELEERVPVGIQTVYHYQLPYYQPAARTRTPSGDSGHPDSPQSTDLSVMPPASAGIYGGEVVKIELPQGSLFEVSEVSDTMDEGIEVHLYDKNSLMTVLAPVQVEEVQTIDNDFNYTGLVESAMDTL